MSIFLGINGAYEHAMSVVGVFFILITIAVAYIIRRKRSERGKDKLILRTFVDAFFCLCVNVTHKKLFFNNYNPQIVGPASLRQ